MIEVIKNKFTILKGPLPVHLLKHSDDTDVANIDKILTVCGALTNLYNNKNCLIVTLMRSMG